MNGTSRPRCSIFHSTRCWRHTMWEGSCLHAVSMCLPGAAGWTMWETGCWAWWILSPSKGSSEIMLGNQLQQNPPVQRSANLSWCYNSTWACKDCGVVPVTTSVGKRTKMRWDWGEAGEEKQPPTFLGRSVSLLSPPCLISIMLC